MRMTTFKVAAAAATLAVAIPGGSAMAVPSSGAGLQATLDRIVADGSVSAIAEVRRDGSVWRGSSGSTEVNGDRPAPVDGRFRAGSVTKSFVATVVLQLVSEGRLRLTDSAERWLPGLIPGGGHITMTDLLAHSSGLPDYTTALLDGDGLPYQRFRTWSPEELVRLAHPEKPDFPPGTKNVYSNTNYIVLGMVIEKVTGHPYRAEIQRRILKPLGLRHTWLPGAFPYLTGPHAHGYLRVERTGQTVDITTFNPSMAGAAGEIISTTTDLNRFFSALLGGRLLAPARLRQMEAGYGLGLEAAQLPCGTAYGHGGGTPGYFTVSFTSADHTRQLTLSVATWSGNPSPAALDLLTTALCP
jgi:D-alanyl-D-alanine carboxypeptidase